MKKNRMTILAVIVIAAIMFSIIAFAVPFKHTTLFWISYGFGMFSIVFQWIILLIVEKKGDTAKSKFYGFPIWRIGVLYMVIQVILSIVFMALSSAPIRIAASIFALLLFTALIGLITMDAVRDEVVRQDQKMERDTALIMSLRASVRTLSEQCSASEAARRLSSLADEFRFSDPVSSDSLREIEADLKSLVGQLREAVHAGETDSIIRLCKETSAVLKERNALCKESKGKEY